MTVRTKRRWNLLGVALLFGAAACTPFSKKMDSWTGQPIERWLAIPDKGGEHVQEVRGPDEQGTKIYVISISKHCQVFWTVNAQGIITAWRSEGSGCKYLTQ
jgi:hypothetical protein